jgi:Cof subfamily protein (haloacid dehalogenase superfamily)
VNLPDFAAGLPKAVAIDLDGTLLDSHARLSQRSRRAVAGCIAAGIPVIIATSRPCRTAVRALGSTLAETCSLVLENGAVVRASPPLSGNYKVEIPPDTLEAAVSLMTTMEPDIGLTLEIEGREFGGNVARTAEDLRERNAATPEMYLSLEAAKALGPSKIAASHRGGDLSPLVEALEARFGDVLSIVPGNGLTFLNITMKEATKTRAIETLLASAGWTLGDVLALGDDTPDLDMLRACGTAVAMANACDEVLAACPYRTLSNDEEGVAAVLKKLLETSAPR